MRVGIRPARVFARTESDRTTRCYQSFLERVERRRTNAQPAPTVTFFPERSGFLTSNRTRNLCLFSPPHARARAIDQDTSRKSGTAGKTGPSRDRRACIYNKTGGRGERRSASPRGLSMARESVTFVRITANNEEGTESFNEPGASSFALVSSRGVTFRITSSGSARRTARFVSIFLAMREHTHLVRYRLTKCNSYHDILSPSALSSHSCSRYSRSCLLGSFNKSSGIGTVVTAIRVQCSSASRESVIFTRRYVPPLHPWHLASGNAFPRRRNFYAAMRARAHARTCPCKRENRG